MSNYRRLYIPGGTYFFTIALYDRREDLLVREIDALRASWKEVCASHPFETLAAVVLPDHLHFIWRLPEDDPDFSARIRLLKSGFTRRLPSACKSDGRKGERNIWQRCFCEHAIRSEEDLDRHIDYVHFNPLKHEYVSDRDEWLYSTWHEWKKTAGKVWRGDFVGGA